MLGPLEVAENGHRLEVRGTKERTLLAMLLLHANETVSTERLIDELWGEEPPKSAAKLVSTYVWQLRKTLGDTIVTRAPGYAAIVEPETLDVVRFEQLVDQARELEPAKAVTTLRAALALWRGRPLEDVTFAADSREDVARLEDRRLWAVERRIDHELSLGRAELVLPELQGLVAAHPYREHFRAQLMLALYRTGRQTDALAAYRDARSRFADELGIEPGPELRRLERSILEQDSELDGPNGTRHTRPGRWRRALLAASLAAAALAGAAWLAFSGDARSTVAVGPNAVAVRDPATGGVVAGIPVGNEPGAIVSGPHAVFAANFEDRNVSRIDPAGRRALDTIPVDGSPTALALSRSTLWAISRFDRTVTTIDLEFDAPRSIRLALADSGFDFRMRRPTSGAVASGRLRIGATDGALLNARGREVAAIEFPIPDLVYEGDSLWVVAAHQRGIPSAETPGVVYRLDPATGDVESTTPVGREPNGIAAGLGSVWVVNADDGTLERLDPVTAESLDTIHLGEPPIGIGPLFDPKGVGSGGGIAVGEGSVWVTDGRRNALLRYEPKSGRITRIPLDAAPADVAVGHGLVWVTLRTTG